MICEVEIIKGIMKYRLIEVKRNFVSKGGSIPSITKYLDTITI